jgi:hypothetical protein
VHAVTPRELLRQRRELRRELTRGNFVHRLRGLVAIPPGAPRS